MIDDLNSQSVARNVDGDLMTTAEIEALTAGLAKGWDLVDGVSKQLGNINKNVYRRSNRRVSIS